MPAASDPAGGLPSLPQTWRPLGVRIAVVFFGLMLLIVCTAAWLGLDPDVRARFTTSQRATLLFFGALFAFGGWLLSRCRVTAEMEGLVVVNGLRTRRLAWEEVLTIELGRGAPWATVDLADGTTIPLVGLQGSDGQRTVRAVRDIRALLNRRPGT